MHPFFKRFFITCLVLAMILVGGMQGRKAYKRTKSKRLITLAAQWLEAKDFAEAAQCLQSALKENPSSFEVARLSADLFENLGSPQAIAWRIRTAQLQPTNPTNRLDWAQTAIKLRDTKSAQDALAGVDEKSKDTARYHKIAGALAWSLGNSEQAQKHYQEALRLEPGNLSNVLNLGTAGLISTNQDASESARLTLQRLATNGPLAVNALRHLALDAAKRKDLAEALDYTKRVVTNPGATFADKLDYLDLLRISKSSEASAWLVQLKQQATNSSSEVFALGKWLATKEGPTNALNWLCALPSELQTKQPTPLVITDCQIALKDWEALAGTVEDEDWGSAEAVRLAEQSLAARSLGKEEEAQSLWAVARRDSVRHLDVLYALTRLTGAWGWAAEQRDLLKEVVSRFPREKWAVQMLAAQQHVSEVSVGE